MVLNSENGENSWKDLKSWLDSHSQILDDPWSESDSCNPERVTEYSAESGLLLDPTFDREDEEESEWSGKYNRDDNLEGFGTLSLYDGDTFRGYYEDGLRNGWGVVASPTNKISSLTGNWRTGFLQGKVRLVTDDTSVYEGWCSYSKLNGPVRKIVCKKFRTFRQQVTWLGRYKEGVPYGQCWQWMEGGGYITGVVDDEGKFSGSEIAFLYPDLSTALLGEFEDAVMKKASPAVLVEVNFNKDIAVPIFKRLSGADVWYSKSTETWVGDNPLVADPYEHKMIKVETSQVEGGGEGLYARRDILEGEIVAFYNGVRLPYRVGEKENWETSGYKIFVNADYKSGERIDLPGDLIYLKNYQATLGHKMNHNFIPNCTEWFFDHPRHGIVPCARTLRNIREGEELFLHYGYDPLNCPSWYKTAIDEFLEENPNLDLWQAADPQRLVTKLPLKMIEE